MIVGVGAEEKVALEETLGIIRNQQDKKTYIEEIEGDLILEAISDGLFPSIEKLVDGYSVALKRCIRRRQSWETAD